MGQSSTTKESGLDSGHGARDVYVYILYIIQTGSEASPTSYPQGIGALLTGLKQPGREAITHLHAILRKH
jgi:hypothetical protein